MLRISELYIYIYNVLTQLIVKHFNPFDNYLTATYLGNLTIDIIIPNLVPLPLVVTIITKNVMKY